MLRGLYTAATGMLTRGLWQDILANNLANVTTPGFKRDFPVFESFPELLISRITDITSQQLAPGLPAPSYRDFRERVPIGLLGIGTDFEGVATDFSQGPLIETGNPLDLALDGDGFFVVQTPHGERYTRNGAFTLNEQGFLVTHEGFRVTGQDGGHIRVPLEGQGPAKLEVSASGTMTLGGKQVARLRIVRFQDPAILVKEGDGLFRAVQAPAGGAGIAGAAGAGAAQAGVVQAGVPQTATAQAVPAVETGEMIVRQGFLEMSNANSIKELVSMIECLRAYETNQKTIAFFDQTLDKAVNEVGRA